MKTMKMDAPAPIPDDPETVSKDTQRPSSQMSEVDGTLQQAPMKAVSPSYTNFTDGQLPKLVEYQKAKPFER